MDNKQIIWANMGPESPNGVLLWEIFEVITLEGNEQQLDLIKNRPETYTECLDGTYIMVTCQHYFSIDLALNATADEFNTQYYNYVWAKNEGEKK